MTLTKHFEVQGTQRTARGVILVSKKTEVRKVSVPVIHEEVDRLCVFYKITSYADGNIVADQNLINEPDVVLLLDSIERQLLSRLAELANKKPENTLEDILWSKGYK